MPTRHITSTPQTLIRWSSDPPIQVVLIFVLLPKQSTYPGLKEYFVDQTNLSATDKHDVMLFAMLFGVT